MMKFIGFIMFLVFGFTLNYFVDVLEHPFGFIVLAILFTIESVRSYIEGLNNGVEIISGIRKS